MAEPPSEPPIEEIAAAEESQQIRRPSARRVAIRIVVGFGVIAFLVARADLRRIGEVMGDARPAYIAGAFVVIVVGIVVSAVRWQAYLKPLHLTLPVPTLFRLYFVGVFFNAFLPTGIGGDAYKAIRLRRGPGTLAAAFASVFLDRYAGAVGLALIGMSAAIVRLAAGDTSRVVLLSLLLSAAMLGAAGVMVLFGERLLGGRLGRTRVGVRVRRMLRAFETGARDPAANARGIGAGLAFQAAVLGYHVLLAEALGFGIPVAALAALVVISSLATMIPVTINGLGFREGAYVWALGVYGIGHDAAFAFALLVLGVLLGASAVGGIVYIAAGGHVADEVIEASAGPAGAWHSGGDG